MDRLFNSTFENSLRLLILLDEYDMPQTLDMLYAVDFMTIYSKPFGLSEQNLNGDNDLKFSEFASQRDLVKEALKDYMRIPFEFESNGTQVKYYSPESYEI